MLIVRSKTQRLTDHAHRRWLERGAMRLMHVVDKLLQRGVWMPLKMVTDGGFYALTQGTRGVPIKRQDFHKPQATFRTDSALVPTRFGSV